MSREPSAVHRRIWDTVRRIPRGRVATYGQVGEAAGLPGRARLVGYALAALPEAVDDVPWHRVINARGEISRRAVPGFAEGLQRVMLESEGVVFEEGRVALERFGWRERGPRR